MDYLTMTLIGVSIIWTAISFFLSKNKKVQKKLCEKPEKGIFLDKDDETTIEDMKKVANEIFSGTRLARTVEQYKVYMVLDNGVISEVTVKTDRSAIKITQEGCTYTNRIPSAKKIRVNTFLKLMTVGVTVCMIITCVLAMISLNIYINGVK